MPNNLRATGFFLLSRLSKDFGYDQSVRLPYSPNVGKVVTITTVSAYTAGDNKYDFVVAMTEVDTGLKFLGRTIRGSLEGLGLVADIDKAKQQFMGKVIYPKRRTLELVNVQSPRIDDYSHRFRR